MKPNLGDIVIYRSRTGNYDVPAIVNCTVDSIDPRGVELGHVPALSSDSHVHLTVLTPGKPGMRRGATDFVVKSKQPISENVAGCYQEWDIPFAYSNELPAMTWDGVPAGSWRETPRDNPFTAALRQYELVKSAEVDAKAEGGSKDYERRAEETGQIWPKGSPERRRIELERERAEARGKAEVDGSEDYAWMGEPPAEGTRRKLIADAIAACTGWGETAVLLVADVVEETLLREHDARINS